MRRSGAPSQRSKINCDTLNTHLRSTSNVLSLLQPVIVNKEINVQLPVEKLSEHEDAIVSQSPTESQMHNRCEVLSIPKERNDMFKVVWGKKKSKKHKTFESDGILKIKDQMATLFNEDGAKMGSSRIQNVEIFECGYQLCVAGKEVEIVEQLTNVEKINLKMKRDHSNENDYGRNIKKQKILKSYITPVHITGKKKFFAGNTALNPLVFPQPSDEFLWSKTHTNREVRTVTLDSFLTQALRPHQREGILFLYECVMGYRSREYMGAILADEMGLGKTLQCISLIWTLLKQGPYGIIVCKKVLVVVPSSLCLNWYNEFIKWLGRERLDPYVVDKSQKASEFNKNNKSVMIISYEMFVRCYTDIVNNTFDLVVCDEGHKLKNSNVKASQLLSRLPCKRRILLTGTPIQNDLQEYFSIVNLVNPGILGTYSEFRKNYEVPILASQKPGCNNEEHVIGSEKALLLNELTTKFLLRRTQDILEKFLPSKRELIVCCELSSVQKELYNVAIDAWACKENKVLPLQMINILKKICNFPSLLNFETSDCQLEQNLADLIQDRSNFDYSVKLQIIKSMLKNIVIKKKEKIVLVSYSTQFLNVLSDLCTSLGLQCFRLDGSTPVQKRQHIVDCFNQRSCSSLSNKLVFLLSAKAGGVGLNLSAASRLVLVDSDWNPASDLQATARVWRDGQMKGVFIYKLLSAGSIEEKVYQRQVSKTGLSDAVKYPENLKDTLKLSEDVLKDLFTPNFDVNSLIHNSISCNCDGSGTNEDGNKHEDDDVVNGSLAATNKTQYNMESINQLKRWQHFKFPIPAELITDAGLDSCTEVIKFIFHRTCFS